MGVLNISPESFYSDSFVPLSLVADAAERMITSGAELIDIGARSTAPGSPVLSVNEEISRVSACLNALQDLDICISVDTMHPEVLSAALRYDVSLANDISGLINPDMGSLIADANIPAILMASHASPGDSRSFTDTLSAIQQTLSRAGHHLLTDIILDPGIGRWIPERTPEQDWELCRRFHELQAFELPLLAAVSRKSFIGARTGQPPKGRLAGTLAVTAELVRMGASVIRAHDIAETKDVIDTVMEFKGRA